MRVLRAIDELSTIGGDVHLAIGVFDGLHLGHQAVIRAAVAGAEESGGTPVVVTFNPHPIAVLRPDAAPRLLTSARHQRRILESMGISHLLEIEFTGEFARREPREFILQMAQACGSLAQICVGAEWHFGRARSGNVAMLTGLGEQLGFSVCGVEAVRCERGEVISSTLVRAAIDEGNFARARDLLGRDYTVLGEVVHGRRLGGTIGFPTANLAVHSEQLPPSGVYAVSADLSGERLTGVANLGRRPTVEGGGTRRQLEVHLFDFDRDIYGRELEVLFVHFLREEKKFENLDALKSQIGVDADRARALLVST